MSHTLQFETAWDKTIAPLDRDNITAFFHSCTPHLDAGIHFSFFREATNHRGDLLVTVLIHNVDDTVLHLQNKVIAYQKDERVIATGIFSIPCAIKATTSMPWTFIFSSNTQLDKSADYVIDYNPRND